MTAPLASDLRAEIRRLASGFLLTLSSGFGQTYFIALFAGHLKAELGIGDGAFGSLYTAGTLASAALLVWAGKLADRVAIRWLGVGVLAGLALAALGMATVASAWMLALVLFGLRFCGQGMLTHTAMTAMGRWFNRKRGRAVAIAGAGLPAGEAVLPLIAVASMALIGWRLTWVAIAVALVALSAPVLIVLLRRERTPSPGAAAGAGGAEPVSAAMTPTRHEWTRGAVLRSPLFYALMPGLLAPPFVITGIFFNQVTIVESKGWALSWIAAAFPVLAGANVLAALATGWLVDRFGARRLLPVFLVPLGLSALLLAVTASAYALPAFMALIGMAMGSAGTVQGALWPELYGTRHLGAIRAVATAVMVFATALAPGLIGVLLDAGVAFEAQALAMGLYCLLATVWMGALMPRLHRLAAA